MKWLAARTESLSGEGGLRSSGQGTLTPRLLGENASMRRLRFLIEALGDQTCTVLIHGESGTGKELVARQIHASGRRAAGPFVPVDCASLRDTLAESQLFGHVRGAFTGAQQATLGFFRAADGGTLFLDEIAELDAHVQAKLLRCIQDGAVVPLGGVESIPVDVRIIGATHRDLTEMTDRGQFREDLYFRLDVVRVEIPPLRDRRDDIPLLAEYFLDALARRCDKPAKALSADALAVLAEYRWPGNVRELANALEHACALSQHDYLTVADLPEKIRLCANVCRSDDEGPIVPLAVAERSLLVRVLRAAGGNQALAARMLRIDRRRLYRKVRHYALESLTCPNHSQ